MSLFSHNEWLMRNKLCYAICLAFFYIFVRVFFFEILLPQLAYYRLIWLWRAAMSSSLKTLLIWFDKLILLNFYKHHAGSSSSSYQSAPFCPKTFRRPCYYWRASRHRRPQEGECSLAIQHQEPVVCSASSTCSCPSSSSSSPSPSPSPSSSSSRLCSPFLQ